MSAPSPTLVLLTVLVCVLFTGYQLERANDALVATTLRRDELYPIVADQCEADLIQFCRPSPLNATQPSDVGDRALTSLPELESLLPESSLNDKQAGDAPSDQPGAALMVTPTRQLRTTPVHSRSLTEDTNSDGILFPYECLEAAWKKNLVSVKCSTALFQLRGVEELKHQQQRNCETASWVFWASWCWLVCYCADIGRHLSISACFLFTYRFVMWDFVVQYHGYFAFLSYIMGFATGHFMTFLFLSVFLLNLPVFAKGHARRQGDISNEEDQSPGSEQDCITGQSETRGCACCKAPTYSDNPSELAESCCECCMGSGACRVACESCCDKECCKTSTDATTEQEILIPALVVGERST